jgi:hypothetical protein
MGPAHTSAPGPSAITTGLLSSTPAAFSLMTQANNFPSRVDAFRRVLPNELLFLAAEPICQSCCRRQTRQRIHFDQLPENGRMCRQYQSSMKSGGNVNKAGFSC